MQRRYLNAPRNIGRSAIVLARALKVEGSSASGFFHYDGIKPQYIGTSSLPAAEARITSIGVVGAMLNRGARLRGGPLKSARRWISAQERFCVKRPHMEGAYTVCSLIRAPATFANFRCVRAVAGGRSRWRSPCS